MMIEKRISYNAAIAEFSSIQRPTRHQVINGSSLCFSEVNFPNREGKQSLKVINALIHKFLSRMEARTVNHDQNYFYDAILAFAGSHDPTIAMAALAAAKKARREPRAEYVKFINAIAEDEDEDTRALLHELADSISAKDWTIRDAIAEGLLLSEIDEELASALNEHDSDIFRRRFPHLF